MLTVSPGDKGEVVNHSLSGLKRLGSPMNLLLWHPSYESGTLKGAKNKLATAGSCRQKLSHNRNSFASIFTIIGRGLSGSLQEHKLEK